MKPYEEVCFPSGIIRWTRENNLYVCRLTEDQMNEIKEIHETPYTKTYSGGKPNYTQPIKREPILPGGGIGRHPDIQARKEGDLIVADLPQVPTGSGGIRTEPTIDGWPLYSGLPDWTSVEGTKREYGEGMVEKKVAITQDETVSIVCHESVAQYAQVNGIVQPEPVAYIDVETRNLSWAKLTRWETPTVVKMDKVPLYTAPPKKEWVGLTNEEIEDIRLEYHYADGAVKVGYERAIEAKLKEKNT